MVDLEALKTRGLRAYEVGRLRTAAHIAVFIAPAFAVCWLLADDRETCSCLAVLLTGIAVWLRWRDRRGADDVTLGLVAGLMPMTAGLALGAFEVTCGEPVCLALSAAAGVAAGAWIALHGRRSSAPLVSLFAASVIAALAASIGCVSLGVLGMTGVVAGIAAGSSLGALRLSR
jgi:hypothetical protein